MVSSTSDNLEARAWADAIGAASLAAPIADVAGLVAALRARRERSAERGVFADLAIASWLETHPTRLVDIVALAHIAMERGLPRNAGAISRRELAANAWLSHALRASLARVLPDGLAELPEPGVIVLLHLWDTAFGHSLSPFHLAGLGDVPCDVSAPPIVRSMFTPFTAPDDLDLGAVWASDAPIATKLLLSLWGLALPVHEVDRGSITRLIRNVTTVCPAMLAAAPPPPFAVAMCYALCTALFRAAYHEIDHIAALSAAGDFVTATVRGLLPAFATQLPPRPVREHPRIGYLSTNFRAHPVTMYMGSRIFERSSAFEVVSFVLGTRRDAMTERIRAMSDRTIALPNALDYAGIARAIRDEDLDLLVFADVGMDLPTYLLSGLHLARRQVVMMGHAASSGMPGLTHYLGGDHESPTADRSYREVLVRLPSLGAAQQPPSAPARILTRVHLDIPDDAIVFVNCGNAIKHVAERDDVLAQILERCPNAFLVLKPFFHASDVDPRILDRIRAAAARRGVAERLVIVPPVASVGEVMDLYILADIQIDTYPFGGWTTNLEALHAGLPLVTREGELARNRFGAAMLRRLEVTDGIAHTDAELVDCAVRLATDPVLRASLRQRILAARSVLFAPNGTQPVYEKRLADLL